jgi:hypothetical protein
LPQLPAGGDIDGDGQDKGWLPGLTGQARQSINATSPATADDGAHGPGGGPGT